MMVDWLYSAEVMTPIGPRMLSLRHAADEGDYYGYQGSGAVWSVTNGIIAKGLGHRGLSPLRRELGIDRLQAWFNRSGEAVELTYVHRETNEPCYDPYPPLHPKSDDALVIGAAELGQIDQGWGASAALAEIWASELGAPEPVSGSWQRALCRRTLARARESAPAVAGLPERAIYVDIGTGQDLAAERARQLGFQR
jgi:glycogen debranching enzyme